MNTPGFFEHTDFGYSIEFDSPEPTDVITHWSMVNSPLPRPLLLKSLVAEFAQLPLPDNETELDNLITIPLPRLIFPDHAYFVEVGETKYMEGWERPPSPKESTHKTESFIIPDESVNDLFVMQKTVGEIFNEEFDPLQIAVFAARAYHRRRNGHEFLVSRPLPGYVPRDLKVSSLRLVPQFLREA